MGGSVWQKDLGEPPISRFPDSSFNPDHPWLTLVATNRRVTPGARARGIDTKSVQILGGVVMKRSLIVVAAATLVSLMMVPSIGQAAPIKA